MIGFVVKHSSNVKNYAPIAKILKDRGEKYIIFKTPTSKGFYKNSEENMKKFDAEFVNNAEKIEINSPMNYNEYGINGIYGNDLLFSKQVRVYIKSFGIKIFNVSYFTDTAAIQSKNMINNSDKNFYTSKSLMELTLKSVDLKYKNGRDIISGLPMFENIKFKSKDSVPNNNVVVLLPSLKKENEYIDAFGRMKMFDRFISKLAERYNLFFKTRQKIYISKFLKRMGCFKNLLAEGTHVNDVIGVTQNILMFYSNGIFEYMLAGANIINFPITINKRHKQHNIQLYKYFSHENKSTYNYHGAVYNLSLLRVLDNDVVNNLFDPAKFDDNIKKEWINKFIGISDINHICDNIVNEMLTCMYGGC